MNNILMIVLLLFVGGVAVIGVGVLVFKAMELMEDRT